EDTSATNFMVRDGMMQQLIASEREPITPFIDQVENLHREHGVSTVLVMGGSGDYFSVADTVIAMHDYLPEVVTARAREIAAAGGGTRLSEGERGFGKITHRVPLPRSIDPRRGGREKVTARGLDKIEFGRQTVDLASVEQLVDASQTRAIGEMVRHALKRGYINGAATLSEAIDSLLEDMAENGLDSISPYLDMEGEKAGGSSGGPEDVASEGGAPEGGAPDAGLLKGGEHPGEYALPRRYEIAAMLNRMRSLRVDG
ncbi:MAG: P-loop domain-containing protein, partial [Actinomycetota bacterium]